MFLATPHEEKKASLNLFSHFEKPQFLRHLSLNFILLFFFLTRQSVSAN